MLYEKINGLIKAAEEKEMPSFFEKAVKKKENGKEKDDKKKGSLKGKLKKIIEDKENEKNDVKEEDGEKEAAETLSDKIRAKARYISSGAKSVGQQALINARASGKKVVETASSAGKKLKNKALDIGSSASKAHGDVTTILAKKLTGANMDPSVPASPLWNMVKKRRADRLKIENRRNADMKGIKDYEKKVSALRSLKIAK